MQSSLSEYKKKQDEPVQGQAVTFQEFLSRTRGLQVKRGMELRRGKDDG